MIKFACPKCGAVMSVPDDKAGVRGTCPKCKTPCTVPSRQISRPSPQQQNEPDEPQDTPAYSTNAKSASKSGIAKILKKKYVPFIGIGIIVVVAAVIMVSLFAFGGKNTKKASPYKPYMEILEPEVVDSLNYVNLFLQCADAMRAEKKKNGKVSDATFNEGSKYCAKHAAPMIAEFNKWINGKIDKLGNDEIDVIKRNRPAIEAFIKGTSSLPPDDSRITLAPYGFQTPAFMRLGDKDGEPVMIISHWLSQLGFTSNYKVKERTKKAIDEIRWQYKSAIYDCAKALDVKYVAFVCSYYYENADRTDINLEIPEVAVLIISVNDLDQYNKKAISDNEFIKRAQIMVADKKDELLKKVDLLFVE